MDKLQVFALFAPALLFSMVAHEYAHGYAALLQGDTTAQKLGRLTWNPLKHIDPMMTIVMPIVTYLFTPFIFGGAKPVPVDPRNYRHPVRGDIIVSMAGIFVNLCLAVICTLLIVALGWLGRSAPSMVSYVGAAQAVMVVGVFFNVLLALFNLLPIPPLDGSHVFKYLLPPAWALHYERIGFLGIFLLILLLPVIRPILIVPLEFLLGLSMGVAEPSLLSEARNIIRNTMLAGLL